MVINMMRDELMIDGKSQLSRIKLISRKGKKKMLARTILGEVMEKRHRAHGRMPQRCVLQGVLLAAP